MAVIAKPVERYSTASPWRRALLPLIAAVALCAIGLGVDAVFADRALPRVTVAGVEAGTLRAADLHERLVQEAARPWAAASVTVRGPDGLAWITTNGELAIAPDVDRAVTDALAYGHTGSLPQRLVAWANALRGRAVVPFAMRSDGAAVDAWVGTVSASLDRPAADGAIVATYRGVQVTPAVI
ncbi:MAG: peptidoglycan binding domain-containing protein, partial [Mycobacteriales bacterium]